MYFVAQFILPTVALIRNFASVRILFFIILSSINVASFGQDTLDISWSSSSPELTTLEADQIDALCKGKIIRHIEIIAYFSSKGKISSNRILAEVRLANLRSKVLDMGVPFHLISSKIISRSSDSEKKDVSIRAFFYKQKEAGVLKKSSVVQISKFDLANRKDVGNEQPIQDIKKEQEIVLDEAAFKKNATVSLPNLIFQGSSHYFLSGSERVLRALAKVMRSRTDIRIELQGHVCCNPPGVDAFDIITGKKNLSVMRARAVYDYLIQAGIEASRMTYRGFGSSKRLYPEEKNPREKMLNRRVEVLITASD